VEFYYGMPNKIHTPWGYYMYGGSGGGDFDQVTKELLQFVNAKLLKAGEQVSMGYVGPFYIVQSVDGIDLPEPSTLSGFEEGFYDAAKDDWARRMSALRGGRQ
jgi:hypothetical protein